MKKPFILWGGPDINPKLYGQKPLPTTDVPDMARDRRDSLFAVGAVDCGQPVVGICRGAQLLCVLNGGKLHQHNPRHRNNNHPIVTNDGEIIENVAADHHQTMIPRGNYVVYGVSSDDNIPEIIWWPERKCLAVQPHPEWMDSSHPFNVWLNKLMRSLEIDYSF